MRKAIFALLISAASVGACHKPDKSGPNPGNLPSDGGCIERVVVTPADHLIKSSDVAEANALFSANSISTDRFRYYQYLRDSLQTYYAPYTKFDEQTVKTDEFTNGLRVFTSQVIFQFKNGKLDYQSGHPTGGTSLDTNPALTLGQLRKLFVDDVERFDHAGAMYKDTCLKAEFGYYDINAGTSNAPEVLVKAWRITRKNSSYPTEYPVGFYRDGDGARIGYDNGIRWNN